MTVAELVELLKACDPKARVVVSEEPMIEDDRNILENSMQDVRSIEAGFVYKYIASDLTFYLEKRDSHVAAVRIVGLGGDDTPKRS